MNAKTILESSSRSKPFIKKLPALKRMILSIINGNYKTKKRNFILAFITIIYVLSPIDFIPDFILGLGLLDDVALILFALSRISKEIDKFVLWEKEKNNIIIIEPQIR